MRIFFITFFVLLLSLNAKSFGQNGGVITSNYTSRHFTIADGLPQIQITRLFTDSKGFVWVGTKFGVARWDGKNFKYFTPKEGTSGSQVTAIGELSDGTILVGWISNGFNIIIGDYIESVEFPLNWDVISVTNFGSNGKNGLYIGLSLKNDSSVSNNVMVAYYDLMKKKFTKEFHYKDNWIGAVTGDGYVIAGTVLLGQNVPSSFRLYRLDTFFTKFTPSKPLGFVNSSISFPNPYLTLDRSTMFRLEIERSRLVEYSSPITVEPGISNLYAYAICEYSTESIIYYNGRGDIVLANKDQYSFLGKVPSCNVIMKDRDNNVWVGTENGLYCFYSMGIQEMLFTSPSSPSVDEVWSMAKSKDGTYYYASFSKGFWHSTDNNKTWSRIPSLERLPVSSSMKKGAYGSLGLSNGAVILSTSSGFYYLDKNRVKVFDLFGKGAEVYSVMEDNSHRYVYINKWRYLFKLDLETLELDTLLNTYNLNNNSILNVVKDEVGNPIITGSVRPHILKDGKWSPYRNSPQRFGYTSLYDHSGSLWLGSAQKLTCVREDTVIEMKNFPARQEVVSMVEWNNKWLIIGGGVDLIFFDLGTYYNTGQEVYRRFDAGSGFTASEGGQNSFLIDKDGSIWWCCSDKILHFWPEKILAASSSINSPVFYKIQGIDRKGTVIPVIDSFLLVDKILPVGFRRLEFLFGTAALSNHDFLVYRFRLHQKDTVWSLPQTSGQAIFDNLSPGVYNFEVQSSIDGIKWSTISKAPSITIPAYWYEELWFYFLLGVLSISIIVLVTWTFSKWKQGSIERQKQLNELQLKAIRSKALPHFTGNSFANIDFYIEKGDTENASRYLAILSRLHNITLADSDKPSRSIEEEIDYVKLYLQMEKLRFEHRLEYIIEVDPSIDQEQQVPNMVLHTYAENALKHGLKHKEGNGLIVVKASSQTGGVLLSVTDNGIGREAAARMKSFGTQQGLSILGKQIELYNQQNKEKMVQEVVDMLDEEGSVVGTRFAIFIPSNFKY